MQIHSPFASLVLVLEFDIVVIIPLHGVAMLYGGIEQIDIVDHTGTQFSLMLGEELCDLEGVGQAERCEGLIGASIDGDGEATTWKLGWVSSIMVYIGASSPEYD